MGYRDGERDRKRESFNKVRVCDRRPLNDNIDVVSLHVAVVKKARPEKVRESRR